MTGPDDPHPGLPRLTLRRSDPSTLADLGRRFYDEATQTMPRDELAALQLDRLRDAVDRALNRPVPLFARKLAEAGVESPEDVTSVDHLDGIPTTVKQELRDSEAAHPPVGDYRGTDLRENVRIGTSTGTTGTPTHSLWTRHDLLVDYELGARMFWRQGVRPGMVMTHAHPAYLYAGGPMLQGVYEHLGCLSVWVPPPDTDELAEQALRFWQRVTPDRPFMGFATGRFLEVAEQLGIDQSEVGLDFGALPPMNRPGDPLPLMTAGAECLPYLGSNCEELDGGHVCEDHAIVQALDPDTGQPVPDGEWGVLTVTTLGRDNFLLRYDLEEAAKLDRSLCPCGETHLRGWWGGRFKDLVTVQGRSFLPFDVERPLKRVTEIRHPSLEYQVVRPAPGDRQAPMHVRVEASDEYDDHDAVAAVVRAALTDALEVDVRVEVLDRGTLPRSGYKATRILDHDDHGG